MVPTSICCNNGDLFEKDCSKMRFYKRVAYGGGVRYMTARDLKTIQHLSSTPWHIPTESQITDGTSKNELGEIIDSLKSLKPVTKVRYGTKGLGIINPNAQKVVDAVPKKNQVTARAPFGYV